MSMPEFPEVDPCLTPEAALSMIISSIAMEEAALGHILCAESEKLRYVVETAARKVNPDLQEILAVNQSITCLLDSVFQNQIVLKSKLDKAVCALPKCPCPPVPPCPPPYPPCPPPHPHTPPCGECCHRCCASFIGADKCQNLCYGTEVRWNKGSVCGRCASVDLRECTKIRLCGPGRYQVGFALNASAKHGQKCGVSLCLQMLCDHRRQEIYTLHSCVEKDCPTTLSMGGVLVENKSRASAALILKMTSKEAVSAGDCIFSITEL